MEDTQGHKNLRLELKKIITTEAGTQTEMEPDHMHHKFKAKGLHRQGKEPTDI